MLMFMIVCLCLYIYAYIVREEANTYSEYYHDNAQAKLKQQKKLWIQEDIQSRTPRWHTVPTAEYDSAVCMRSQSPV